MTHTLLEPVSTEGPDMAQAYVWTRGRMGWEFSEASGRRPERMAFWKRPKSRSVWSA